MKSADLMGIYLTIMMALTKNRWLELMTAFFNEVVEDSRIKVYGIFCLWYPTNVRFQNIDVHYRRMFSEELYGILLQAFSS